MGLVPAGRADDPRRHRRARRSASSAASRPRSGSASSSPASVGWRSRSASTSPATAPTRPCSPAPSSSLVVGLLFYLAGQVLAVSPRRRRRRLRARLPRPAPRLPARLGRPLVQGRPLRPPLDGGRSDEDGRGGVDRALLVERGRQQRALAWGQGAEALVLVEGERRAGTCGRGCGPSGAGWSAARRGSCSRSPRGTRGSPPTLDLASGDRSLQLRSGEPHSVGAGERLHVLRRLRPRKRSSVQGRSKQRPLGLLPQGSLNWFS